MGIFPFLREVDVNCMILLYSVERPRSVVHILELGWELHYCPYDRIDCLLVTPMLLSPLTLE